MDKIDGRDIQCRFLSKQQLLSLLTPLADTCLRGGGEGRRKGRLSRIDAETFYTETPDLVLVIYLDCRGFYMLGVRRQRLDIGWDMSSCIIALKVRVWTRGRGRLGSVKVNMRKEIHPC